MSKPSLSHPVGRVRVVGMIEGLSFLVLLGVAMPLKYFGNQPEAVRWPGIVHGGLFVLLMLLVAFAWGGRKLSTRDAAWVVLASILPFGPFLIDRRLARDEREVPAEDEDRDAGSGTPEAAE